MHMNLHAYEYVCVCVCVCMYVCMYVLNYAHFMEIYFILYVKLFREHIKTCVR